MLLLAACGAEDGGRGDATGMRPAIGRTAGAGGGAAPSATAGTSPFGNPMNMTMAPPANPTKKPDLCEVVHLSADPQVPDFMIVLDRSGSMQQGQRWQPSVAAVRNVTMQLDAQIRWGLTLFPDPAGGNPAGVVDCIFAPDPEMCLNGQVCAPGKVVVPVGDRTAAMVGQVLGNTMPNGGTPTSQTLEQVLNEFVPTTVDPDAKPHPKYVLLVTDGQPTCPAGRGQETTQPDIDASNAAIDALRERGAKTYVIGYDTTGPGNEMLASVLDGFAMRGGTGDTMHRPVEDEQSLVTELQSILGAVVGCSFALDKAPPRAEFVLVRLDGQQINLGTDWMLSGDRMIEITGAACEKLKDGGAHTVDAEVRCEVVVPM